MGVRWNLNVVSICSRLRVGDVDHLSLVGHWVASFESGVFVHSWFGFFNFVLLTLLSPSFSLDMNLLSDE